MLPHLRQEAESIYLNESVLSLFSPLFPDSKTFVDSCLLVNASEFHQQLQAAFIGSGDIGGYERQQQNQTLLLQIYRQLFIPPSGQLLQSMPLRYENIQKQQNENQWIPNEFKDWSLFLFHTYKLLLRQSKHLKTNDNNGPQCQLGTLLQVDNPYVVAGGRFTESYYWDSYFIVKSLPDLRVSAATSSSNEKSKQSDKVTNVRLGMIQNFCQLIRQYGFVPNGSRLYYLNRSQPPLLPQMFMEELLRHRDYSQVVILIEELLPCLEAEYNWWKNNRQSSTGLSQYRVDVQMPRPESFVHDSMLAMNLTFAATSDAGEAQQRLYSNLASAAESGWDFSSRWYRSRDDDGEEPELVDTDLWNLIPVDLNAIMCGNERVLAQLYGLLECHSKLASNQCEQLLNQMVYGWKSDDSKLSATDIVLSIKDRHKYLLLDETKPDYAQHRINYYQAMQKRKRLMRHYLWNQTTGIWLDYDIALQQSRSAPSLYLSAFYPLWQRAYDINDDQLANETGFNYTLLEGMVLQFEKAGFFGFPGGIPTSLYNITQQQWDFPNAWAPLQWIVTEALMNLPSVNASSANPLAQRLVPDIVQKWITSNYCGWRAVNPQFSRLTSRDLVHMVKRDYRELDVERNHLMRRGHTSEHYRGGMHEKYDVEHVGAPGTGGEYEVVDGFGWTNGVALDYVRRFSKYQEGGSSLPSWFKHANELEILGWQDGVQLPKPGDCPTDQMPSADVRFDIQLGKIDTPRTRMATALNAQSGWPFHSLVVVCYSIMIIGLVLYVAGNLRSRRKPYTPIQ